MNTSQDDTTLDAHRAEIDALVRGLPEPRHGDQAFDEPWQIRAFALAVGAYEAGEFEWPTFQRALIESIEDWETHGGTPSDWSYYEHWVKALETVLGSAGKLDRAALETKTREVLATPADRGHHQPRFDPIAIDPGTRSSTH
ncbi:nitrile hydratase accessory protein [Rhodococcoides fascians]|uniref:nitrile hydratase accessory protein n=1 Tax=Rhodococcoides fascians TaxID=1828 RepID=UPI00050CCB39|nr:nitrile hydratase accessory protein [Rhodococcus fascians]